MAKQVILTSGTPTTLPDGAVMINANFTELYTGAEVVAATAKTTPADTDLVAIQDSAASNVKKKVTWANVKATLKTYFDTLYAVFASQAEAQAGTNNTKYMTPLRVAEAIAALGTRGLYGCVFVDQERGSDITGTGNLDRPFATVGPALTLAASLDDYTVVLGYGAYTLTLTAGTNLPANLKGFRGCGETVTALTITVPGLDAVSGDDNGGSGGLVSLEIYELTISVHCPGGQPAGAGNGGHGGTVTLRGHFVASSITAVGNASGTTPGDGGTVDLFGARVATLIDVSSGGGGANPGYINLAYCDLRGSPTLTGAMQTNTGNCACSASVPGTDKGGNSTW